MLVYGDFNELRTQLLYEKIASWTKDELVLENGTRISIEMSESDCCAYAGGQFEEVQLDAVITDVIIRETDSKESYEMTENYAEVILYHNYNEIAKANCYANNGNGGYYYSVCSLVINDVHYKVCEA